MQKDEFIKILNAIVDARIKKIVPAIVKKEIADYKEKLVEEIRTGVAYLPEDVKIPELAHTLKEELLFSKTKQATPQQQKKIIKTFSKDSTINAIMQQTAEEMSKNPSIQDEDAMQEYKKLLMEQYANMAMEGDMKTFNFDSSNVEDIASRRPLMPSVSAEIEKKVALEVGKKQIEAQTGNPELGGLIMRDYRNFMKKVDEKAKNNPNRVRTGV